METKYTGDTRIRVVNKCNYDIGISLMTGQSVNLRPGSPIVMTVNDIMYVESICAKKKFFSSGMICMYDNDNGEQLTLEKIGGYTDSYTEKHYDNDEINANLRKSVKAFGEWLKPIEDPSELHAIWDIARTMDDLPASKLKLLKAKLPQKDLLEDEEAE